MNEIWQLIVSNRQWIFEGIGVFLLSGILLGIKHLLSKRRDGVKTTKTEHATGEPVLIDNRKDGSHQPHSPNIDKSEIKIDNAKFNFSGKRNKLHIGKNVKIQTKKGSANDE